MGQMAIVGLLICKANRKNDNVGHIQVSKRMFLRFFKNFTEIFLDFQSFDGRSFLGLLHWGVGVHIMKTLRVGN